MYKICWDHTWDFLKGKSQKYYSRATLQICGITGRPYETNHALVTMKTSTVQRLPTEALPRAF